jgi:hypothetical protein
VWATIAVDLGERGPRFPNTVLLEGGDSWQARQHQWNSWCRLQYSPGLLVSAALGGALFDRALVKQNEQRNSGKEMVIK